MSLKGTKTEQNLLKAFAGESQAAMRYGYFAKVARKEGYNLIADIFEENAKNETAHAKEWFKLLEGGDLEITAAFPAGTIGTTIENLKASAFGEHEEASAMYPGFAEIAREEGFNAIAKKLELVGIIEAHHEARFAKLLKSIEDEKFFEKEEEVTWMCDNCGHTYTGTKALKVCPVCTHDQGHMRIKPENY